MAIYADVYKYTNYGLPLLDVDFYLASEEGVFSELIHDIAIDRGLTGDYCETFPRDLTNNDIESLDFAIAEKLPIPKNFTGRMKYEKYIRDMCITNIKISGD